MKTYYVQLTDLDHAIEFRADENPTLEDRAGFKNNVLVFKYNGDVVAHFLTSHVKGWWYRASARSS